MMRRAAPTKRMPMAKKTDTKIVSALQTQSTALKVSDALMERIVLILEAARGQVVRTVNASTVTAYWLIGRELVEAIQQGEQRASYGQALIARLAKQLTERYGKGFSATNLDYFRRFYLTYADQISHPLGGKSLQQAPRRQISHPVGGELPTCFTTTCSSALCWWI